MNNAKNIFTFFLLIFSALILGCSKTDKTTEDYLKNNADEFNKQYERCKKMPQLEAIQDEICQTISKIKKGKRSEGYTDKGKPVEKLDKLPGR